jgi:thiamine-phosphate pyrophosphorylase
MAVVASADEAGWALRRGATILQLRIPGAPGRALEKEARAVIPTAPVPLLVNARVDVALAVGAFGVHLPEQDVPVAAARRLLGDRLVGRSVHSLEAALEAESDGADYLVLGPVFATATHSHLEPLGLEALREVAARVRVPVLAIGGVDEARAAECLAAGAAGFAAIRYFQG